MKKIAYIALLLAAADQASKAWLRTALPLHAERPLTSFFSLVHVENTGAAFGILPQANALFVVITLIILGVLVKRSADIAATGPGARLALPLVMGGALGNLVDRLWLGAVTDFLDFHVGGWHWPAFNVADGAISIGVLALLFQQFSPFHSGGSIANNPTEK